MEPKEMQDGADMSSNAPMIFGPPPGPGNLVAAVLVPIEGTDGLCETLTLYESGTLKRGQGDVEGELAFLEEAGCIRDDSLELPHRLQEAIQGIMDGEPPARPPNGPA